MQPAAFDSPSEGGARVAGTLKWQAMYGQRKVPAPLNDGMCMVNARCRHPQMTGCIWLREGAGSLIEGMCMANGGCGQPLEGAIGHSRVPRGLLSFARVA